MIKISFWTQDPNIKAGTVESASKFTADPRATVFSKSANPLDLPQKFTIRVHFKAKSVDPKTYSPPLFEIYVQYYVSIRKQTTYRNSFVLAVWSN